jgi:uncharacterized protein YyaL (SSP411 family)
MRDYPAGFAAMAMALEEQLRPPATLILRGSGEALGRWQTELAREYLPEILVLGIPEGMPDLPAVLDKPQRAGAVNGWLCRGVTCLEPISDLLVLKKTCKEK